MQEVCYLFGSKRREDGFCTAAIAVIGLAFATYAVKSISARPADNPPRREYSRMIHSGLLDQIPPTDPSSRGFTVGAWPCIPGEYEHVKRMNAMQDVRTNGLSLSEKSFVD